jgi:prepilin-type N-terminal cleavage/methylation domain-containing protein
MDKRGFTLLELLVVMAIIGILSALAVSVYYTSRLRGYEAVALSYMRSWVPAQELYMQKNGHYADADGQLAQSGLGVLYAPRNDLPYDFSIDSTSQTATTWWGRGTPKSPGLRYFYVDQTGAILSSMTGPPDP